MDNREDFLAVLRAARAKTSKGKQSPSFSDLLTEINPGGHPPAAFGKADDQVNPVELLRENCGPLNLYLHTCSTREETAETIVSITCRTQPEFTDRVEVVMHDHPDIHKLQLPSRLETHEITCHCTEEKETDLCSRTMASCIGVTVADWGIAESGTIVQFTAPGRPRSTSLVPAVHIALLRKENLLPSLAELYALLDPASLPDSFVFISGPSKTADIEAHMVLGAHGPREMHLILVDNMGATR